MSINVSPNVLREIGVSNDKLKISLVKRLAV